MNKLTALFLTIGIFYAYTNAALPDVTTDPAAREVAEYLDAKVKGVEDITRNFTDATKTVTVAGTISIGWERIECNVASGAGPSDCSCTTGKKLLGGGVDGIGAGIIRSYPSDDDTWTAVLGAGQTNWKIYAICARVN